MLFLALFTTLIPLWSFAPLFKNLRDKNLYNSLIIFSIIIIIVFRILDFTGLYTDSKAESYYEFTFLLFLILFRLMNKLSIIIQKRDLYFYSSNSFIECEESKKSNALDFLLQTILSLSIFIIMLLKHIFQ